jgi:cytochrome c-type biogenesis protein CcmH
VQCQNTSIAGSSVELAADLREQIREMIAEGASDSEITEFLVARYGDFIMYRPPLKPTTWALWGGPVAMLGIGVVVFWRVARSRAGQSVDDDGVEAAEAGA